VRVTTGNLEGGAGKTTTVTVLDLNRLAPPNAECRSSRVRGEQRRNVGALLISGESDQL